MQARARAREARNLLGAGRSDRSLNERVETLEFLMELVMADLDTLNSTLDAIADDAAKVATKHGELVAELEQLQAQIAANQPVDLSGAIAKASNIKTTLDSIAADASASSSTGTATDTGGTTDTTGATDTSGADQSGATDASASSGTDTSASGDGSAPAADAGATDTSGASDGSTTTETPAA